MKFILVWVSILCTFLLQGQLFQKNDFSLSDSLDLSVKQSTRDTFKVNLGESFLFRPNRVRYQMASGISYSKQLGKLNFNLEPYILYEYPRTRPYYIHSDYPLGGGMVIGGKEKIYFRPLFQFNVTFLRYFFSGLCYGHRHYGDGYRSFLPSRQSPLYPWANLGVRLRNLLFDFSLAYWQQNLWDTLRHKFTVIQYVRWRPWKWLSLGFYESATWSVSKLRNMGAIELTYLQPFAFLRPIDYSMGSPANMFMAGLLQFRWKSYSFYMQVVLDEFYISEYKNELRYLFHPNDTTIHTGAWVNKQALQMGMKSFSLFGMKGLGLLMEVNIARPYTYSHSFPELSFSHQNQPVAHPLGANFFEAISWLGYAWRKNAWVSGISLVRIGLDASNTHVGQNILQPTSDGWLGYNIPVSYYGNHIAQGNHAKVLTFATYWMRKISLKNYPFRFYVGVCNKHSDFLYGKNKMFIVMGFLHHMSVPDFLNW
ncbi:MAG: hypothetical protein N2Z72_03840 [Bacteroidales bacterium]|nr:hypothetical protein [Bacteroidales bacterium]